MIVKIKLPMSNAYLIKGERPVLVDTGAPGDEDRILAALHAEGIAPHDLALIVHTHAHGDHAGSTAALHQYTAAPTLLHTADVSKATSGDGGTVNFQRLTARMLYPMVWKPFTPFTPQIVMTESISLHEYGVAAQLIHTPGHTTGSISVILDTGEAIAGDVLMGGSMGGTFFPSLPRYHYFYENWQSLNESIQRLINMDIHTLHIGHGGPLSMSAVRTRFAGIQQQANPGLQSPASPQ